MSYNTAYPQGFEFNLKVVIDSIDNDDGDGDECNYQIVAKDSNGEYLVANWVGLDTLEELISTCDPEKKKQATKFRIARLQKQIEELNKELEGSK